MTFRKSVVLVSCTTLFSLAFVPTDIFASVSGSINGDNINLRSKGSTESNVINKIKKGTSVEIEAEEGDFYKVTVKNDTGYIAKQFISTPKGVGTVLKDSVNLRQKPDTTSSVVGKVSKGECVTVKEDAGEWFLISSGSRQAYIRKDLVKCDNPPQAKQVVAVKAQKLKVEEAKIETKIEPKEIIIDSKLEPKLELLAHKEVQIIESAKDIPLFAGVAPAAEVQSENTATKTQEEQIDANLPAPDAIIDDETQVDSTPINMYTVVIAKTGLNFRQSPSMEGDVFEIIPYQTVIDVVETGSEWVKINYAGKEGYVKSEYILVMSGDKPTDVNFSSNEPVADGKALEILDFAKQYLGTPYKYGSTNLEIGVDCSGFVTAVMSKYGIKLPRSSSDMSKFGTPIQKSDLRAGDLVFFSPSGNVVSHVGIYMGDGKFIHSTDSKGKGVSIGNLNDDYRVRAYDSARRVIQ